MFRAARNNFQTGKIYAQFIGVIISFIFPFSANSQTFVENAASSGAIAEHSVFKITCLYSGQGSGFLHKSGLIVTAAHVTRGCEILSVEGIDGALGNATVVGIDDHRDVALLKPDRIIKETPLRVKEGAKLNIGESVAIWGYPGGYAGATPLLAVGVVAGRDICQGTIQRTVINAAINHGDSGGPVVDAKTGEVIGISVSKVIPLQQNTQIAMAALGSNPNGLMYTVTAPNGASGQVSESQVINQVLNDLASQVQLVVGCAVSTDDLQTVLKNQGLKP